MDSDSVTIRTSWDGYLSYHAKTLDKDDKDLSSLEDIEFSV